jgi:hypothetical protein
MGAPPSKSSGRKRLKSIIAPKHAKPKNTASRKALSNSIPRGTFENIATIVDRAKALKPAPADKRAPGSADPIPPISWKSKA